MVDGVEVVSILLDESQAEYAVFVSAHIGNGDEKVALHRHSIWSDTYASYWSL